MAAVTYHRIDAVELLIKNGARIHDKWDGGGTPIGMAEGKGYKDIVNLLRAQEGKTGEELRKKKE